MLWQKPTMIETCLAMEINCYALSNLQSFCELKAPIHDADQRLQKKQMTTARGILAQNSKCS
ncbi:pyrroloquinoline quinone precursor peptide PqqA [Legionella yabuuchiae]|uniref:pyrroloquinoline quinone precursor peptide PqqA n=1 Tax=Legionella yabuuchiae TaxID=376727 RepID=UPI00105596C9